VRSKRNDHDVQLCESAFLFGPHVKLKHIGHRGKQTVLRRNRAFIIATAFLILFAQTVWSITGENSTTTPSHSLNPIVLIGIAVVLLTAKLGGEVFERLNQPAVLGELVGGLVVGNLTLLGLSVVASLSCSSKLASKQI
jgi:hypothetical protein